jgi:hypothetical protein
MREQRPAPTLLIPHTYSSAASTSYSSSSYNSTATPPTNSTAHSPLRECDVKRAWPVSYAGPSLYSVLSFAVCIHPHPHRAVDPRAGTGTAASGVWCSVHARTIRELGGCVRKQKWYWEWILARPAAAEHGRAVPAAVRVWAPPSADAQSAAGVFAAAFAFACAGGSILHTCISVSYCTFKKSFFFSFVHFSCLSLVLTHQFAIFFIYLWPTEPVKGSKGRDKCYI